MKYMFFSAAMLLSFPAFADLSRYETPQYSGQTPRFDRELDGYRDADNALRASERRLQNIQRDRRDDLAVDRKNALRNQRVQGDMSRRRDEAIRTNQNYILKTNE